MIQTFRDTLRRIAPPWLQNRWGGRLLYAIGVHLDAVADATTAALKLRFPGFYSNETLGLIGRERGILRGLEESDEAYAQRLRRWWDDRKRKGSPYALANQLQNSLWPHLPKIRIANVSGSWFTLNEDGTFEVHNAGWNWDGDSEAWSRFWVIVYAPESLWKPRPAWNHSGQTWGSGTWGTTATSTQIATARELIREWQAPHSRCAGIIIAFDPASFDPVSTPANELPDGAWGNWSKDDGTGHRTSSRVRTARYWKGT